MFKKIVALLAGLMLMGSPLCFAKSHSHGAGHTTAAEKGTAILLVTFGTSVPEAQKAFDNIGEQVKKAFPDVHVAWAFTSYIIREKLAKEGKHWDSPEIALAKLMDQGYSNVVIQSLHMIPGMEFHEIYTNANLFEQMSGGFDNVYVAYPLLAGNDNMNKVVDGIVKHLIPKDRKKEDAVILMGHGTHHASDAIYSAMMYKFQQVDPNIFVGTVEGHPTYEDIKAMIDKKGIKKAYLLPMMSVSGDHSINDLAGDEKDSWKSMLTAAGVECVPVLKGIAEVDALADLWVNNLKKAMSHVKK